MITTPPAAPQPEDVERLTRLRQQRDDAPIRYSDGVALAPMVLFQWIDIDFLFQQLDARDAEITRLRAESEGRMNAYLVASKQLAEVQAVNGHGDPCIICGEPCSSLAGNPAKWPVRLGNDGWRHVGCINKMLRAPVEQPSSDTTSFCQRWRNSAWGDSRYAEFCQEADTLFAAARRAGAEEMQKINAPVIEAANALIAGASLTKIQVIGALILQEPSRAEALLLIVQVIDFVARCSGGREAFWSDVSELMEAAAEAVDSNTSMH